MKLATLLTILLCFQLGWSQDHFEDAVTALGEEMSYSYGTDSTYKVQERPQATLINAFKQCSGFEGLSGLGDLPFNTIKQVKIAELTRSGADPITFQEWTLPSEAQATDFMDKLNSPSPRYVQFCVSEGGMMWWRHNDKLYMITSNSFATTFKYSKIKEVINRGLQGRSRQP